MFSSAVCCTDSFYDLSDTAQALYFQLGFEADNDGVVGSVRSVARKCGYDKEKIAALIDELMSAGLLLEILDTHLISHWWVNNKFDKANYRPGDRQDVRALVQLDPTTRVFQLITDIQTDVSLLSVFRQSDDSLLSDFGQPYVSPQYKRIECLKK